MMNIHARQERLHVVPVLPPMTPNLPPLHPSPMQCVDCNRKTWRRHQHVGESIESTTSNVVAMLREATKSGNRLALAAGAVLGGASSVAMFTELHPLPPLLSVPAAIALGMALFSAPNVYSWTREAFRSPLKAFGWTLGAELVAGFSAHAWLSWGALALLVTINAVATGCNLARRES